MAKRKLFAKFSLYLVIGIICVLVFVPILWIILTSFKTESEVYTFPPTVLPQQIRYQNFLEIFTHEYGCFTINSVIVASGSTILTMIVAILSAYGYSRFKFRGNKSFLLSILITRMIPPIAIIVPLYFMVQKFDLYDTKINLVLLYTVIALPLAIWMLKIAFDGIPQSLEDAARLDGCSNLGILVRIILPVAGPALASTTIITFLTTWNEFLFPLIFTGSSASKTLPVAIAQLTHAEYGINWGNLCAMTVIMILPILVIALSVQKYVVSGLMAGVSK